MLGFYLNKKKGVLLRYLYDQDNKLTINLQSVLIELC